MKQYGNFIGGRTAEPDAATPIDVNNPATGRVFSRVTAATGPAAIAAVEAAARAQKDWGSLPAIQRGDALRRLADAAGRKADAIGAALALESGKSRADAVAEVGYAIELMRFHAEWARRIEGEVIESDNPDETLMLMRVSMWGLAWRAGMRFAFTTREYGPLEGLRSVLRIPVANVITIMAGRRALLSYFGSLLGRPVEWDKTAHQLHPARSDDADIGLPRRGASLGMKAAA